MDNLIKALLDVQRDEVLVMDPGGKVLHANQSMLTRLGVPDYRLVGTSIFQIFPPDVAARRRKHLEQAVSAKEHVRFEDATAMGKLFEAEIKPVLDENGEVGSLVVRIRDVSARHKVEEERFRLASAVEQAMEAFIIMDDDMVIHYVNQAFEGMTGYAYGETRGRPVDLLYQGEDQKRVLANIKGCLKYTDSWAGRTNNTRKDGDLFMCEQTISRIRGKGFQAHGFVSIWRDVTETAHLEKQLRQAQKMEAIGTLAGGIAHDFNNILGPIILHSELCLTDMGQADPYRQSFEEILSAATRAKNLVDQILGLSRGRESDKPIPFHLSSIVKECLKLLRPSLPSSIRITYENRAGWDLVMADPTQIHQVIMNLCTNSVHAMGEQPGELALALSDRDAEGQSMEDDGPARLNGFVCLDVRDTGCGIPTEDLGRIFDPFYTTKKEGKGTGLGLAVVKNIVTGLGGRILVDSLPGRGTRFRVLLPRTDAAPDKTRPPLPREGEGPLGRVLLVDPDTLMLQGARTALEYLGYEVAAAANASEALAYFRAGPDRFDLMLADVNLPEMSGQELAAEVRLNRPDLPVILCSAYADLVEPEKVEGQGIRSILKKPFLIEELSAILAEATDKAVLGGGGRPWPGC